MVNLYSFLTLIVNFVVLIMCLWIARAVDRANTFHRTLFSDLFLVFAFCLNFVSFILGFIATLMQYKLISSFGP